MEKTRNLEHLLELAGEVGQKEREVFLDFNNPQHDAYFCEQMGGTEHFQKEFPALYEIYLKTKQREQPVTVGEYEEFRDGIQIVYGYQDAEHQLHFKGITALGEEMDCIGERITIYHESSEKLIVSTGRCTANVHSSSFVLDWDNSTPGYQTGTIIFDYFSMWYDSQKQTLQARMYRHQQETYGDSQTCVTKITMSNPTHIQTSQDVPIVVCYNRKPSSIEKIDYDYSEAFDNDSHIQKLFLDVSGEVQLDKSLCGNFQWVDMTSFVLKLFCDSGMAVYYLKDRVETVRKSFQGSEEGFTFQLDKDWKGVVPSARLPIVEDVDFLLDFSFTTEKTTGKITVGSDVPSGYDDANVLKISKLQLLWGCVEGSTSVRMEDGSQKAIRDIRVGDRVSVYGGGSARVENVFQGQEQTLWRLETEKGRFVVSTKDHPILTKCGLKMMQQIHGSDLIVMEDGEVTKVTALYPVSGGEVYSLMLEKTGGEPRIVTNGLVTGDITLQNRLLRERSQEKGKQPVVSGELRRLQVFFEEGN